MNKRIIAILLAMAIIPVSLMAAPFLQVGPLVSYNHTVVEFENEEDWGDINNFSFGADVRINPLKHLSIDIPATLGFGSQGSFSIAAIPTLNINIPLGNIVDIAVGAGTQLDFQRIGQDGSWSMNGLPFSDFGDAIASSKLVYRAAVTINLGPLGIGAVVTLPGEAGFNSDDIGGIFTPMWESTRISAVALFNFG